MVVRGAEERGEEGHTVLYELKSSTHCHSVEAHSTVRKASVIHKTRYHTVVHTCFIIIQKKQS